ncbi:MAG: Uma2 family endonuclease [Verrucomicrobiales bacterium]|nr:Uma2 family endonuclease [Verrucomicrobiales bacterium]
MQTATRNDYVTVEDYLAAEEKSDIRHEYLGGLVYAMAGETRDHNTIALNLAVALRQHLKGKPCDVYIGDIRVNFDLRNDEYYYYPDIVVTCDKRETDKRFVHYPKLIIEVLSPSTERVDKREKFFAYTSITSLEEYALVSQAAKEVTAFRRANNWKAVKVSGPKASVALESLRVTIPLSTIFQGV